MAEHKEGHDHRHADAAKHSANGANGGAMHQKGVHGELNEDIRNFVDENTIIKNSSSIIHSKDSEVPEVIGELKKLGELANKKAVLELDKFLEEQEKNHEGRKTSAIPHALIALGKTEDKSMSTRIIRWMHDKHPDVRAAVADAVSYLGDTDDRQCSKAVAEMLKDHDDRVRLAAVRSLGSIGDDNVILSVCALAADPSSEVRAESVKAVVAILKNDFEYDVSGERLHRLLLLAKTVKDSFTKLEKGEKISLVRNSFDSCINDITTILISHEVKDAKNAAEAAQREKEKLIAENQQARQILDKADKSIGDLAEENHELRNDIKDLKKKLEEAMLRNGELVGKLIDIKSKVEKAEKFLTETEALKQEVESLREQLSSEEGRRKAFGGTEKELQKQILTYKREVEEAGRRDDLYKRQIDELQSTLRATLNKAGAEMSSVRKEIEEAENIKKEKQDIEAQIAGLKKELEEKTGKMKNVEDKSKELETLESKLKESDEKIKTLENQIKTRESNGMESITGALDFIESNQKLSKRKNIGYKIGIGFLAAAVLIESGLLVRSTIITKKQDSEIANLNYTKTQASKGQDATQKLTRAETAYKEISSMDFVIGKFFTDPEAIISLHYKGRSKAEARKILDECRDNYWSTNDSIKEIGPEKACEEMRKYYILVDMVGSGKLKDAKGEYKKIFGKEFKLMVF